MVFDENKFFRFDGERGKMRRLWLNLNRQSLCQMHLALLTKKSTSWGRFDEICNLLFTFVGRCTWIGILKYGSTLPNSTPKLKAYQSLTFKHSAEIGKSNLNKITYNNLAIVKRIYRNCPVWKRRSRTKNGKMMLGAFADLSRPYKLVNILYRSL